MPRFVISASSDPLPPSLGRSALEPSALPSAKEYTYFGARGSGLRDFPLGVLRALASAIQRLPGRTPVVGREGHRPATGWTFPESVSALDHNVNRLIFHDADLRGTTSAGRRLLPRPGRAGPSG